MRSGYTTAGNDVPEHRQERRKVDKVGSSEFNQMCEKYEAKGAKESTCKTEIFSCRFRINCTPARCLWAAYICIPSLDGCLPPWNKFLVSESAGLCGSKSSSGSVSPGKIRTVLASLDQVLTLRSRGNQLIFMCRLKISLFVFFERYCRTGAEVERDFMRTSWTDCSWSQ